MIVFAPTVQHTGTWFLLRFLEHYTGQIVQHRHLIEQPQVVERPAVLHTHIPVTGPVDPIITMAVSIGAIVTMASLFPTVIPLRDPLSAILTREARHPELRHFYIVDGFVMLAERMATHPNVMFLSVDLGSSVQERETLLASVAKHCGFSPDHHIPDTARQWPVHNATPGNQFKDIYAGKRWQELRGILGEKNEEIDYLASKSSTIKPFMRSMGYRALWP